MSQEKIERLTKEKIKPDEASKHVSHCGGHRLPSYSAVGFDLSFTVLFLKGRESHMFKVARIILF